MTEFSGFTKHEEESLKTPILGPIIGIVIATILFLIAILAPGGPQPPGDGGSVDVQSATTSK